MTRILATGDTQIGATTVTLESQSKVLAYIAAVAFENRVDLVLHGGDVFEGPIITPEQLFVFSSFVAQLREDGIPLVVITGNGTHDAAMRNVNGLEIFEDIPGITVCSRPDNVEVAGVTVSCLPWTSPARMVANGDGGDRDRINQDVAGMLVGLAARMHAIAPKDKPNVLLAHWSISGASLPTGLPVDQLREPVIEWADLDAIGYDAVIAAHIHKSQQLDNPALDDATPGVYVGSPQMLSHGESGYEHGVWMMETHDWQRQPLVSLDFLPIEAPRFVTAEFDPASNVYSVGRLPGRDAPHYETVAFGDKSATIEVDPPPPYKDAIVRVRYTATREQDATIDKDAIRRELLAAGASRVTIEPNITREVRARDERMTQELSEYEALAMYLEAQRVDKAQSEKIIERLREWIES